MFLILVLLIAVLFFYFGFWKSRHLPPGPTPWPFFGNTLAFGKTHMDEQLARWHRQFGDLYTIWMGGTPVVLVNDFPTIVETFVKDADSYTLRAVSRWNEIQRNGNHGVIFTDGPLWKENRRFALHVLRNFGLGRNLMQERVLTEVCALIDNLKAEMRRGEISIQEELDLAVGSIINGLTFGYSFGKERQAEFQKVKGFATAVLENKGRVLWRAMEGNVDFYKHLPFFKQEYIFVVRQAEEIKQFFFREIQCHQRSLDLDSDEEPLDYVDAFLRHRRKLEREGIEDPNFSLDQLYGTVLDLWIAGQETTANTLAWLCVYLLDHPQVQAKIHEELFSVIDGDRLVTLDDKLHLPYTNAVVAETQRFCNFVPLNLFHRTTRDVQINGFHIPQDTLITHQIGSVLRDPKYFPEPDKFRPERFIDTQGRFLPPPQLIPFGVGKRSCMGESLARVELFLFAANIFNHFKLIPSPTYKSPERLFGATICPAPFTCLVEPRTCNRT